MKCRYFSFFIVGSLLFIITGCSSGPKPLYNYGEYSESYYNYVKNENQETLLELQKSISLAIENTDESTSGRVAPGLYANLGYIYLKQNKPKEAIENFKKEKSIYPESTKFMDMLIKKAELMEEANNDNSK